MIVRCENCGTEFGFDDRQVGEGLTVRCSVCKHVFTVESPTAKPAGWQVLTTDEARFTAPDVATLREWIDEGRLHPDDQVSRTGRAWMRLGDMPEFARAFARFAQVAEIAAPVREAPPEIAPREIAVPTPTAPSAVQRLSAGPSPLPQSQRPTLSPPRSAPTPSPASRPSPPPAPARPVVPPSTAAPPPAPEPEPEPELEEDVELEVDLEPELPATPHRDAAPSWPTTEEEPPEPAPEPVRRPRPARGEAKLELDFEDDRPGASLDAFEGQSKRRGVGPGLIVLLGLVAAVGVVFGVPSIRAQVLAFVQPGAEPAGAGDATKSPAPPELAAAEQALAGLGTVGLAEAEAQLQRTLDAKPADPAPLQVALAELLASRSLAYQIAAALDPAQREDFQRRADDDHQHAARLLAALDGAPDADRLAEVRALARLAAGRAEVEVLPLVPAGAEQTKRIVEASVLWRDLDAPVPAGLVAGLTGLPQRSGLGESVLAVALLRAGDTVAARNAAERLLVGATDSIVGLAVRGAAGTADPASDAGTDTGADGDGTGDTGGDPNVAKAPPRPGEDGGGGSGGASSFDRLVERGCGQVSSGQAAAGIKTLLRAFDIKPNDLDVLTCLGDGYAAQGSNARAETFYARALEQSPSNIPALRGAAKIAVKTGADARAKALYERLLKADPGNGTAQAYLAKHGSKPEPTPEPSEAPAPNNGETGG